mgnify:CR=1 FL=1
MTDRRLDPGEYDDRPIDDPDNPEWTEADFARAVAIDQAPKDIRRAFTDPGRRIVAKPAPKQQVTLRLSPAVLEHFRRTGRGWQTRINEALLKAITER